MLNSNDAYIVIFSDREHLVGSGTHRRNTQRAAYGCSKRLFLGLPLDRHQATRSTRLALRRTATLVLPAWARPASQQPP